MNLSAKKIHEVLVSIDDLILTADGFDEALLGYVEGWFPSGSDGSGVSQGYVAMYDSAKCIQILIDRDGMDRDEAEEFFSFNVTGAYVGGKSPVFATFLRERDISSQYSDSLSQ